MRLDQQVIKGDRNEVSPSRLNIPLEESCFGNESRSETKNSSMTDWMQAPGHVTPPTQSFRFRGGAILFLPSS